MLTSYEEMAKTMAEYINATIDPPVGLWVASGIMQHGMLSNNRPRPA